LIVAVGDKAYPIPRPPSIDVAEIVVFALRPQPNDDSYFENIGAAIVVAAYVADDMEALMLMLMLDQYSSKC
jgi:hypothetical protein